MKVEKKKILHEEILPHFITIFDKLAETNNGYLAVNRLTWADLFFTACTKYFSGFAEVDILENAPNLRKVVENVMKIENIKRWVERRPKSNF